MNPLRSRLFCKCVYVDGLFFLFCVHRVCFFVSVKNYDYCYFKLGLSFFALTFNRFFCVIQERVLYRREEKKSD